MHEHSSSDDRHRLVIRLHFAPRLLAYGVAAVLFALAVAASEEARPLRIALCAYCLLYPWAAQLWAARVRSPRRTLDRLMDADLVNGGMGIAGFAFAPIPSLYLIGVNLVNTIAFGGARGLPRAAVGLAVGAALGRVVFGPLPVPEHPLVDPVAMAGFVVYNLGLAALVRRMTGQLRETTSALRQQSAALAEACRTDPLTGVHNRRDLSSWLAESGNPSVGHVLLDIDHFKTVNDRYGHHAGDLVLAEFARRLEQRFGDRARVLRWGGEEFLLAWPSASVECLRRDLAGFLAELRARPFTIGEGIALAVQCSIGAVAAGTESDWERALALADRALYHAKSAGRGLVFIHGEEEPIRAEPAPPRTAAAGREGETGSPQASAGKTSTEPDPEPSVGGAR